MISKFNTMNKTDIAMLLKVDNVSTITNSRELFGIESLHIDSKSAIVSKELGSGGSKEVYDVVIDDKHYAFALPGTIDSAEIVIKKWEKVLQEPANTKKLRELGLHVNNLCEIVPATINNHKFPALMMMRYSDHDFPIYDSKNPQGRYHELIKSYQQVGDEEVLSLFSHIGIEIATLIQNNISLGDDCFNLCDIKGIPHLYLNDLGAAKFEKIPKGNLEENVKYYVNSVIGAFANTISEEVYQTNSYVHSMGDLESSLKPRLVSKVMNKLI